MNALTEELFLRIGLLLALTSMVLGTATALH
jgi:hypothetical protein